MNLKELVDILKMKPGYLKSGPSRVSSKFEVEEKIALEAIREAKKLLKQARLGLADNSNDNESVITEFESYLLENGIDRDNVASVKFWQTMTGEQRFSVVTKNDRISIEEIKKEIEEFAAIFSPTVYKQSPPFQETEGVAYEISLPDIHYGKLTELTVEAAEEQFMNTVQNLVDKAKGLNIEKFILPIGNDGMNSEGMRFTTTKGTFQHDSIGWRESFHGYCHLMTRAIDYLKAKAPVQIVVVSGNHDFERMFYAGDFIKGWYRNDKNVVVDNSMESRKYV